MKKISLIALLSLAAFAADYNAMSVSELQALRGTVPSADLAAFQSAMQTKVQALSQADRQALQSNMQQNRTANQATMQTLAPADRQALQNNMKQNRGTGTPPANSNMGGMGSGQHGRR